MATLLWIAGFLVPASVLGQGTDPGAEQGTGPVRRVPFGQAPVVDGDLGEWRRLRPLVLHLDQAGQIWREAERGPWGGPEDLSAELYLIYDLNHLYLAGRVRDNSLELPAPDQSWHLGDAIEVFLDLDLRDDPVADDPDRPRTFNEDDLQIFLMPLNRDRPSWGIMDLGANPPRPGSLSLTGFSVAGTEERDGYRFEAAIPFHSFPSLAPGTRSIGFNVALDDHDADTARYQYMTWTGTNPVSPQLDTRNMGRLEFAGPPPLSTAGGDGLPISPTLLSDLPFLLAPLLAAVLLVLLNRIWAPLQRRIPGLRAVVLGGGLLVFTAGVFVPAMWTGWRGSRQEAELSRIVAELGNAVADMEGGTLASYRGAQRDGALIDLLRGRSIPPRQYWTHRPLVELADGFGPEPQPFPERFFRVRPYWIPLPLGAPEHFDFAEPLQDGLLYVVVGRPAMGADPSAPPPRLRVNDAELALDLPFESGVVFGRPDLEVTYKPLSITPPVSAVNITALDRQDLVLVGLNLGLQGEEARPLLLGQASLGGVETDLRGPFPADAGVELAGGDQRVLEIPPQTGARFQKLWLFYRATYPGPIDPNPVRTGATVATIGVAFRESGVEPLVLQLQHQVNVLFELDRHNSATELSPGVRRAFEWEDADRERHVNLVYEVDLPAGATVGSLELQNQGPYRIRFRSVVFGSPRPAVGEEVGDSPLVWSDTGGRLKPEVLARLAGAEFAVYRDGRLSASTLGDAERPDHLSLPREAQTLATQPRFRHRDLDGERLFETYRPLSGDGWQGATLGAFLRDREHRQTGERGSLVGVILMLVSAPVLLVLLSDGLSLLGNLRLRLIGVLSAAVLLPLALLSLVLVGVLEQGHAADREQNVLRGVAAATAQLEEQGRRLRESADGWLQSLVSEPYVADEFELNTKLEEEMDSLIQRQLPTDPDWDGGFLRLDFDPDPETPYGAFTIAAGETRFSASETPYRQEPGIYLPWGTPILGVSAEFSGPEGRYSLTAGRPLSAGLLGTLAPDRSVLLMDTRGYPLVAAEASQGGVPGDALVQHALDAGTMAERRAVVEEILSSGQPVVRTQRGPDGSWRVGHAVLRDAQDTPRAILALVEPAQRATLELPVGAVPVRAFFLLAGGLVLFLSVFLSFLVTNRISRPIEQLEDGARSLSRGDLDIRVDTDARGEIGRLTETFNQMARDLQARMRDLSLLNRGIQDLVSSSLDLSETVARVRGFCAAQSGGREVRVALLERERNRVELHGEGVAVVDLHSAHVRVLFSAGGPFSMRLEDSTLAADCAPHDTALVFPMVIAGRVIGAILILSDATAFDVNLELLTTVASQAATAVVNAQLYRLAVRDPYTGAYMPEHFRQRVVQEVARAQENGTGLQLLGLRLQDQSRLRARDPDGFGKLLESMSTRLQERLPEGGFMCHRGNGRFEVLLTGLDHAAARELLERCLEDLAGLGEVAGSLARYPEDAVSAEFLFDALESGFAGAGDAWVGDLETRGVLPRSPGMREVFLTLQKVAPTDLTILLEGETGTGKEVLADNIHAWSRRAAGPLVKVNCAALAETLLQSELFGHEKGSFTGATARKIGRFELAEGGTIFLDEVGEISLDVQVQLLRVLQEREIDRVGGTRPVPVDVRVVAATNRDLVAMVREGRFREDLYYRLQGMVVRVPPLRERKQEIPDLVEHFRQEAVAAGHTRVGGFSAEAMDELFRRSWPGNIRELRNACFRAMVLAAGPRVELADLMGTLAPAPDGDTSPLPAPDTESPGIRGSDAGSPVRTAATDDPGPGSPDPADLQGRLRSALEIVAEKGAVSATVCARRLGVSPRTGLRVLQDLVGRGFLERVGKRRGARYRPAGKRA